MPQPTTAALRTWDRAVALQRENGQMKLALLKILAIVDPPLGDGEVVVESDGPMTREQLQADHEATGQMLDEILVACWEGLADD